MNKHMVLDDVKNLISYLRLPAYCVDREKRLVAINSSASRLLGGNLTDKNIGENIFDLLPNLLPSNIIDEYLDKPQKNSKPYITNYIFSPDNESNKMSGNIISTIYDSDNNPIAIMGILVDLEENTDILNGLQRSSTLKNLKVISDIIPANVFWLDEKFKIIGANLSTLNAIGADSYDEILNKTVYDLYPSDTAEKILKHYVEALESNKTLRHEELIQDIKTEENKYFDAIKSPILDDNGNVICILGISVDITERKKSEIELAKAKALAEATQKNEEDLRKAAMIFAGSIAHDLTTPLTNMNLMANNVSNMLPELLKIYQTIETNKQNLNETQLAYLEKFPQSLQTQLIELNEFIKDSLKALNKTVAGIKTQDDLVKCELWRCMQKVIDEYPYLKNEKGLIHWDTKYLFNFMGNPLLFYRIMFNLIKNSLYQIREKGRGEIFIRAEQTETHNVLYFKDTAGGVTQETVDNIFNSYQTTKAEGTGVGLAFCKLTMQSFGGEMKCQLVDGNCIEFRLLFSKL